MKHIITVVVNAVIILSNFLGFFYTQTLMIIYVLILWCTQHLTNGYIGVGYIFCWNLLLNQ